MIENHVGKAKGPPEKAQKGAFRKTQPPKRTPRKKPWEPLRGGGGGDTSLKAKKHYSKLKGKR